MSGEGYFAQYRKIQGDIYDATRGGNYVVAYAVFGEIARCVRYNGNHNDTIEIGQSIISRKSLSAYLRVTESQVRTALKALVRAKAVSLQNRQAFTIVTILDKRVFSQSNSDHRQALADESPQTDSTTTNTKKKKGKKVSATPPPSPPFQEQRILNKGEIEMFTEQLLNNLEFKEGLLPRSVVAPYLRCFDSIGAAEDYIAPVFESATRKHGLGNMQALRYISGAMVNHARQERAEHGN